MTAPMTREELPELFLDRAQVRKILIGQSDDVLHITELVLSDIDALPIFTAEDVRGVAQAASSAPTDAGALADCVEERVSAFSSLLGEPAWRPSRQHIETLTDLLVHVAAALRSKSALQETRGALIVDALLNLPEYLDRLEQELIGLDTDMKLGDVIPPGVWADRVRAALRKASLQEKRGDEPVAPFHVASSDENSVAHKAWKSIERTLVQYGVASATGIAWNAAAWLHGDGMLAAPQQSPRLEREAVEQARFMKLAQYDDTIAKAKDDGALSDTGRDIIVDSCLASKHAVIAFADAIRALLSPDTTVVSSTTHLEGCPSGDFGPCDCPASSNHPREVGK